MRNRELRTALLLVLAGAALLALSAGSPWFSTTVERPPPLPPRAATLDGSDVLTALRPLALLGLAGVPALAATRRTGRVLVGLLLAVAGAAAAVGAARLAVDPPTGAGDASAWPVLTVLGGGALALGGLLVAVRGRHWAALGARFEGAAREPAEVAPEPVPESAPAAEPLPPADAAVWDALDRGEDPTTRSGDPSGDRSSPGP